MKNVFGFFLSIIFLFSSIAGASSLLDLPKNSTVEEQRVVFTEVLTEYLSEYSVSELNVVEKNNVVGAINALILLSSASPYTMTMSVRQKLFRILPKSTTEELLSILDSLAKKRQSLDEDLQGDEKLMWVSFLDTLEIFVLQELARRIRG